MGKLQRNDPGEGILPIRQAMSRFTGGISMPAAHRQAMQTNQEYSVSMHEETLPTSNS